MQKIRMKPLIIILILMVAAVILVICNPFRKRYQLPFDAGEVTSVTMYCEEDVEYKELTEQKEIQKIISILTSLKIYEHDSKRPEEESFGDMKFEFHFADQTSETIQYVANGFGYLTDRNQNLKVSFLEPNVVWDKFSQEATFVKNYLEYPVYDTAESLVKSSDLIFSGTVTNVECRMMDAKTGQEPADLSDWELANIPYAYTLYTVKADQVYKGGNADGEITIAYPGGTFGDTTYIVKQLADTKEEEQEMSDVSVGNEYLFLAKTSRGFYPELLNPGQAVYSRDDAVSEEILDLLY